jgi:hypothetical protein
MMLFLYFSCQLILVCRPKQISSAFFGQVSNFRNMDHDASSKNTQPARRIVFSLKLKIGAQKQANTET